MKTLNNMKGITLIALVVTIVVLLILAAVSISMLGGENGIITQAIEAKNQTDIEYEKEQVSLAYSSAKTKKLSEGNSTEVSSDDINEQLNIQKANATARGNNPIIVKFNDSKREYKINNNGEIEEKPPVNIDMSTIYKYEAQNGEAVITGIKDEYLIPYENETGEIDFGIKTASINNLKVAFRPPYKLIVEEIGTDLEIPSTIEENKIVGIKENAFEFIINLKSMIIPSTVTNIGINAFLECNNLVKIKINNEQDSIDGEPWGARNAEIIYNNSEYENFANNYILNKNQEELEELLLKSIHFLGTFDEFLAESSTTREEIEQMATELGMTYTEYLKYCLVYEIPDSWLKIEYQVSLQGGEGKNVEELEKLFIEKNGGQESFENLLKEEGVSKEQYFENICNTEGFRSTEDFLKYAVYFFNINQ